MSEKRFTRKMSYNDRLFSAAGEVCPPGLNQFVAEGEGIIDTQKWCDAVKIASEANPGSRIILKGHLGRSRWVDSGMTPPVTEVDGSYWDGMGPDGAPFLGKELDLRQGPASEVLLIHGSPLRICFRTHHAVMDGMGLLTWMEDIFRVLRGEEPRGSTSAITDMELARANQSEYRRPFPRNNIAPTGRPSGGVRGVTWKRIIIPGTYKNTLGQIVVLSAREAWKYREGPVRFAIPVDLRFRQPGLRSTGNLAIAIYVEVKKNTTPEDIANDIRKQIAEKRDCMIDRMDPFMRYVPFRYLVKKGNSRIENCNNTGLYGSSGLISNMGRVPVQYFSGGGFNTRLVWGIPPSIESIPFLIGFASYKDEVTLSLGLPEALAGDGRMDSFLKNLKEGLVPADSVCDKN
ncbi:MAG TPA: hypothetical protein PK926_07415 [Spirochaetota bacterium]|nr:hypothetical protein [Spirochaetota bacterium]HPI89329.1 hypothetical protein [Spirochaetota bacterium]HPR49246.1 hypothetical protein [Spirochaetota bacterium]